MITTRIQRGTNAPGFNTWPVAAVTFYVTHALKHTLMKRTLLLAVPAIAAIAGGSWAGTTLYSGNESRAAYDRVVADLNDSLGLTLINSSYSPGFLRSEAITDVRLSSAPDAKVVAQLRHVIEHSPVGAGAELSASRVTTTLVSEELRNGEYAEIFEAFGGAEPVQLLSQVGFGGTVSNELTIAAARFVDDSGVTTTSEPAVWNIDVTEDGSFIGSGNWGGATVNSGDIKITIAASSDSFNYQRVSSAVYEGSYDLSIPEVSANVSQLGMSVGARGLSAHMSSDVQSGLMSVKYSTAIADLDAPIALDSFSLEGIMGGIDISIMERLRDIETQITLGGFDQSEEIADQLAAQYASALGDMVKPGTYLGYTLELGNASGNASADIHVTFEGDGSPTGHDLLTSPSGTGADLLRALRIEMNVDAPGDVLALTPAAMFIDPAMLAPWLMVEYDGSVQGTVVMDDLVLDANGQAMPLEMMLGDRLYEPLDFASAFEL